MLMRFLRRGIVAAALVGISAAALHASVLFHCPFDKDLGASGSAGYAAAAANSGVTYTRGRLNEAGVIARGVGPVIFSGAKTGLGTEGAISFWLGSVDLAGSAKQTVNLLSARSGNALIQIFKGPDGFLYVRRSGAQVAECYRYPIYDLQPTYTNAWNKGKADIRHYITYQWGGKNPGLLVNAIAADKVDPASAPAAELAPKDGEILVGDPKAGLAFDEIVIADSQRTQPEFAISICHTSPGRISFRLPNSVSPRSRGRSLSTESSMRMRGIRPR